MRVDDYYGYLGILRTSDMQEIKDTLTRQRAKLQIDSLDPAKYLEVSRKKAILDRIEAILTDPAQKDVYDKQLEAADNTVLDLVGDGVSGYSFSLDDPDPCDTVPGLARKLDKNWEHAARADAITSSAALFQVESNTLSDALRYEGSNASIRELGAGASPEEGEQLRLRYVQLAERIDEYHQRYGNHPLPLLEATITSLDKYIEHPVAQIAAPGQTSFAILADNGDAMLPATTVRPDAPQAAQIVLRQGASRGCLFGYCWIEDSWGRLSSREPETRGPVTPPVGLPTSHVVYFELMSDNAVNIPHQITLLAQPLAAELLKRSRPAVYELKLRFLCQPGTTQAWSSQIKVPIAVTLIPVKAAFEPAYIELPSLARRGEVLTVSSVIRNKSQETQENRRTQPILAQLSPSSPGMATEASQDISVSFVPGGEDIPVEVTIDTRAFRQGERYHKEVVFETDGDNKVARLVIEGTLYPSGFQAFFRRRKAGVRFLIAAAFALGMLLLGLLGAATLPPLLFGLLCGVLIIGASLGLSAWIARSMVRYIEGSGDKQITYDSIPWRPLLISVGVVGAICALLIGFVSGDSGSRDTRFVLTLMFLAAVWGFFIV